MFSILHFFKSYVDERIAKYILINLYMNIYIYFIYIRPMKGTQFV